MTISKPYTFSPGTKAKANEVNDNFDVVYRQVNDNTNSITNNEVSINDLEVNKANKTGSSDTQFNVANPVNGYNAVNKQSMENAINPFKKIIYGLTLRISSSTQIGIDEGSCYGTNGTIYDTPLILTTSTTLNLSGTDTSERPIYITGNSDGTNIQISTTNIGVDKYRQIGSAWTDSDGNLTRVKSYGILSTGVNTNEIIYNISPNYKMAETLTIPASGSLKITTTGWLANSTALNSNIYINDSTKTTQYLYTIVGFVSVGDVLYNKSTSANTTFKLIPCKGV